MSSLAEYAAQQTIEDIAMRAALWEWLMAHNPKYNTTRGIPWPAPMAPADDIVREDLRRILLPRRGLFS